MQRRMQTMSNAETVLEVVRSCNCCGAVDSIVVVMFADVLLCDRIQADNSPHLFPHSPISYLRQNRR